MNDTIFDLAASLGEDSAWVYETPDPAVAEEPLVTPSVVAADSEGRAGVAPGSGAAPFTLPTQVGPPVFGLGVGPAYVFGPRRAS